MGITSFAELLAEICHKPDPQLPNTRVSIFNHSRLEKVCPFREFPKMVKPALAMQTAKIAVSFLGRALI
jgi:hypothetical protein